MEGFANSKHYVDAALARCHPFLTEEENGYPVVPAEAFMGATSDVPCGEDLQGVPSPSKGGGP